MSLLRLGGADVCLRECYTNNKEPLKASEPYIPYRKIRKAYFCPRHIIQITATRSSATPQTKEEEKKAEHGKWSKRFFVCCMRYILFSNLPTHLPHQPPTPATHHTAASSPSWTCSSRRRAVRKGQRTTHRLFNPQHKSLARSQSTQGVVTYPLPSFEPTQSFNISSFVSCDTHSLSFLLTLRLPGVGLYFFFFHFFLRVSMCLWVCT